MDKRFVDEVFDDMAQASRFEEFIDEAIDKALAGRRGQSLGQEGEHELFATLSSMPSCEPGKFQSGKLNVVRWPKRTTPGRRKIPSDLLLAILSRGRIRLPIESIEWILRGAKTPHNFISRLPSNMASLFPEVDVTAELYLMQFTLSDQDISNTLDHWLRRRHETELPNCRIFFAANWGWASEKSDIERKLRLGNFGLTLDQLYKKAGVPRTGRSADEDFVLLVYVSFANELEKFLKPKPVPPITDAQLDNKLRLAYDWHEENALEPNPTLLCVIEKLLQPRVDDSYFDAQSINAYYELPLNDETLGKFSGFARSMRRLLKIFIKSRWETGRPIMPNDIADRVEFRLAELTQGIEHLKPQFLPCYDDRNAVVRLHIKRLSERSNSLYNCEGLKKHVKEVVGRRGRGCI